MIPSESAILSSVSVLLANDSITVPRSFVFRRRIVREIDANKAIGEPHFGAEHVRVPRSRIFGYADHDRVCLGISTCCTPRGRSERVTCDWSS